MGTNMVAFLLLTKFRKVYLHTDVLAFFFLPFPIIVDCHLLPRSQWGPSMSYEPYFHLQGVELKEFVNAFELLKKDILMRKR